MPRLYGGKYKFLEKKWRETGWNGSPFSLRWVLLLSYKNSKSVYDINNITLINKKIKTDN